jgi:putative FmdB family regulatory protein
VQGLQSKSLPTARRGWRALGTDAILAGTLASPEASMEPGRGGAPFLLEGRAVPTYDYRCDQCQRVFEVRQRISEEPLSTCERCGGPVRRLIAPAPFILKGGGWYVTDYPSESRKKAMEAEKKATPETTSSPAPATTGTDGGASAASPSKPTAPATTS